MRVAIVSDVHGNRHAFEAVLDAVEAAGAEELWCLGDLVGYGAEPDACVELARRHAAICLAGNHDLGVTGEIGLDGVEHRLEGVPVAVDVGDDRDAHPRPSLA